MGIDPVTHEPLNKEEKHTESSSPQPIENNNHAAENDASANSDDNSSSMLALLNTLLLDEAPLADASSWGIINPPENGNCGSMATALPFGEEDSYSWLLDCQDFGIHDFGFDCLNDNIELNAMNTLDMGDKN